MKGTKQGSQPFPAVSGFTLTETLVAASIAMIVLAGVVSVFFMSMRAWKEGSGDVSVQSSGRLIIEKIVRGRGGRFGLREAAEGDVTVDENGKGITFLVDKNTPPTYESSDDTPVRVYFYKGSIIYDPSTQSYGDEVPIVRFGAVEDLEFKIEGAAVHINLRMRETSQITNPSQVKFQTKVFLRRSNDPDTET
jgi:type II secretory pathway pseudopilin PulG